MSAANIEMKCFSAAQRPCSFPVFKARAAILQLCDRRARVSRPTVCLSAVVLRTREPLESASRPIPQIVGGKDDEFRKGDIGEDAQNSAIKSNYSVGVDHETSDKVSNGGVIEDDHSNDGNGSIIQNDKCEPINNCNHHLGSTSAMSSNVNSEASTVIDEHERLRRERIGRANKGKVPWNKGKHHKPETIARLRERNKIVMADPKMRERLRQFSHPQSQETREKIRTFMKSRMEFERRQLTIVQEWKDSVASLARRGILGDDELQWDSYQKLKKELHREYYSSKRQKKKAAAPKSLQMEHRLRISEAIRAKWTDPLC
ncbi:hypothetical protein KP509_26G006800 [Ceratopteris richardii]|uniref:Nuclease associated modular domain-containing protein n=1 Tax=Ceratopteris richardii TaxID=49495 RepID=A0A8T2RI20_CERRI|nr:hypothetical protein KP509_26G006800 [Ceratopteris richardii]